MFKVCLVLVVGVFGSGDSSEMTESESVIHSLPPTPLHSYPHNLPYSPIVYPGYGYPGYKEAILLRSPFDVQEVQDALRTKDGDITVSYKQ